jgi:hypothetical protein
METLGKTIATSLASLRLVVIASVAIFTITVTAQADDLKGRLAQDVDAFYKDCPGPPLEYTDKCDNQLGSLQQRLRDLHLTYEQLKAELAPSGRGGRWP